MPKINNLFTITSYTIMKYIKFGGKKFGEKKRRINKSRSQD